MGSENIRPWTSDNRPSKEKELTNKLSTVLAEVNLRRINRNIAPSASFKKSTAKDYLYVYFSGLPTLPGEFDHHLNLGLPG